MPWDLQVARPEYTPVVGLAGRNAQSGRSCFGLALYRARPSLGLFTVATTPPWCPASAAATVAPEVCGTYVNGFVFMVSSMRRKSASSSCFEPVPATVSEFAFAASTKSCAVLKVLSLLTHRKNGSSAIFAIG